MNSVNDVSIVMTGASSGTRRMAALLINKALHEKGFSHVDVVNDKGSAIELSEYVPSVMDLIMKDAPNLFKAEVTVQEVKIKQYRGDPSPRREDVPW